MSISNPFVSNIQSNPWDRLVLGPYVLPGTVISFAPTISYKFDVGKSRGTEKAKVKFVGTEARKISCTINIFSEEQFNSFVQDILPHLSALANGQTVAPWTISHPMADMFDIKQVVITDIAPGMPNASQGWVVGFSFLEYIEASPRRARSTSTPTPPASNGTTRRGMEANGTPPTDSLPNGFVAGSRRNQVRVQ